VKVLLTGFEPFDGDAVNASWEAVRTLAESWDAAGEGADLRAARLPVTFAGAGPACAAAVAEHRPDVLVCVGLAARTNAVRLERAALNVADARIPDNAGRQPVDVPLVDDGPAAYFTGLPIKAALAAATEAGIRAVVSDSAGTFVCNQLFYMVRHIAVTGAMGGAPAVSGFVHVPRLAEEEVDGDPGLPLAQLVEALRIVVRVSLGTAAADCNPAA
jgi:pyroglutamyl-peptidase